MDAARSPNAAYPAVIWNFRYGRYNDGRSFADRVASGGLDALNPPAWAAALSEDDFPEVIRISKARSKETGLQWTRKWYQWGHANYDDFIISETVVENTSASAADGVYVGRMWRDYSSYDSVVNVGVKPTFGDRHRTVEAHVLDFADDLYGEQVTLDLIERVRGERRFRNGKELARQIQDDVEQARRLLRAAR